MEAFGTAFLCFIIFASTHAKNPLPSAAVAPTVGIAYGVMVMMFGSLTGGGINPARDLGPRLITLMAGWGPAAMTNSVVYFVGPFVGGPVGAFLADKVLMVD
jgi:glycerol uptake facilitator-like aquaporin